ncbi:Diacylglycerol O-acyltransferase 1-like protein [Drosera capensis]
MWKHACIRKGWVARQVVKLLIFTGFMGFIIEQYINPIVKNSKHPLKGDLLLNILAELLRFGDREFYKDWWNARTFEEGLAILIAFLLSAIFHELCIAVPCHIFKLWAFLSIMFQVGNMIFWSIFSIFGQPMCVLLYYHDVMNRKVKSV